MFGVGKASVHRIIHADLDMRKMCATFVPRLLTAEQGDRRVNDSKEMVELFTSNPSALEDGPSPSHTVQTWSPATF